MLPRDKSKKTSLFDHASAAFVAATAPKEFKHICVAVEKATNNDLCTPKEKHVQILLEVVRPGASIADVTFLVKYLNQQVTDTTKWLCMLKTHILIHRLLSNCGDEFKSQLKKIQQWAAEDRGNDSREKSLFAIRNWKDDSGGVDANELSGWTRSYANYLEEYVVNMLDIPPLDKTSSLNGGGEGGSAASSANATAMRSYNEADLMNKLPRVQQMMRRLLDCEAVNENLTSNEVVVGATSLLLKDSFKLYRMINDGIIRLIDVFFDMGKLHAMKALDVYRRATSQGDDLERFYRTANSWTHFKDSKFPQIENPPASFLQTMEEYARGAAAEGVAAGAKAAPAPVPTPAPAPALAARPPPPPPKPKDDIDELLGGLSMSSPAPSATGMGMGMGMDPFAAPAAPAAPATSNFAVPAVSDPFAAPIPAPPATGSTSGGGGGGGPPSANPFGANPFGEAMENKQVDLDQLYAQSAAQNNSSPFRAAQGMGTRTGMGMGIGMGGGMNSPQMQGQMGGYGAQGPAMMGGGYGVQQQPRMGGYGGMGHVGQPMGQMGMMQGMQGVPPGGMMQQQHAGGFGMQQQQQAPHMGGVGGMQQQFSPPQFNQQFNQQQRSPQQHPGGAPGGNLL